MSRLMGALVVVALLAAPAVAQARMFCRYTGTETPDCAARSVVPPARVTALRTVTGSERGTS